MAETINLYSDTQTRPTAAMRAAMAGAEVGDEQRGEDPTVNALCAHVADLLGKEAALFLPSGAMCNLIAVKTHTTAGDAIILERHCHIVRAECGGAGQVCGVLPEPIDTHDGIFGELDVRERVRHLQLGVYAPPPTLLCVENTHNFAGGTVWPVDRLRTVCATGHELGLATHMDGARLPNAAAACGASMAELSAGFDSVWIDFSKGLGAPVGAALAGSREFIDKARRYKHMFGGAMRQAGIIAAGALHALRHHLDRLPEDHANAAVFADAVEAAEGVELVGGRPATNIVFFQATGNRTAADVAQQLAERGVEVSTLHGRLRAVTHLDVTADEARRAGEILVELMG